MRPLVQEPMKATSIGVPEIDAPAFGQHGGAVAFGEGLTMASAPGETVYYTLDGSDPREAWTGAALGERYLVAEACHVTPELRILLCQLESGHHHHPAKV